MQTLQSDNARCDNTEIHSNMRDVTEENDEYSDLELIAAKIAALHG